MADRDNGRGYYEPEGPKADDTPTPSTLPEGQSMLRASTYYIRG